MPNVVEIIVRAVDKTKSGLTSPIKNIEDLKKSVENLTPAFTFLATAAATAFAVMAKQAITSAAEMQKMGQVTALGAEYFSTFAYAAEKAGLNLDKTYDALRQWNINLPAAIDKTSELGKMYVALGVQVTDTSGRVRDQKTLLMEIADQFSKTADSAEKTRIAGRLFGETGTSLIPILNKGSAAIKEMQQEARDFGQEVSQNTADSAVEFQGNISRLQAQAGGLAKMFVAEMLPALVNVSGKLVQAGNDSGFFAHAAFYLTNLFKALVVGLRFVYAGFMALGNIIGTCYAIQKEFEQGAMAPLNALFRATAQTIVLLAKGFVSLGDVAGKVAEVLFHFFEGDWSAAWNSSKDAVADARSAILKVGTEVVDTWGKNGTQAVTDVKQSYANIVLLTKKLGADLKKEISSAVDFGVDIWEPYKMPKMEEDAANTGKPKLKLGDPDEFKKDKSKFESLYAEMIANMSSGAKQLFDEEDARYLKRKENIQKEIADEEEKNLLLYTAQQEHQRKIDEIFQEHLDIRAELDEAAKTGDLDRAKAALDNEGALRLADLEGRQSLINTYAELSKQAHLSMFKVISDVANTAYNSISTHITGAILGTEKWGAAFVAIGKEIMGTIVKIAVQWIASQVLMKVVGAAIMAATTATSLTMASTLAGAWAVPATGALIASFGGAAASAALYAPAAISNAAIGQGLALGQAHSGIDYVPSEGTWMLDRGERVIQPEANEQLTSFLDSQNGGGGGGKMMNVTINLDGSVLAKAFGKMSYDGTFVISANAVI